MNQKLSSLSDKELLEQLQKLVRSEKETTEQIIRHLAEVEERKLYAAQGYSSLYDYATRALGYSSSAAMRRIKAARIGTKLPEVFDCLERGELTLSTVEVLSGLAEKKDPALLLEQFRGKSREEAEEIAATLQPVARTAFRDRIKLVTVEPRTAEPTVLTLGASDDPEENGRYFRSAVTAEVERPEKKFSIQFVADSEFMELLERAKQISFRGSRDDVALENVLGGALREFLAKRCPKERERRRAERKARREKLRAQKSAIESAKNIPSTTEIPVNQAPKAERIEQVTQTEKPGRAIPIAIRDQVLKRDEYRCSYRSPDGVACSCRVNLQIDHIVPFSCGGSAEPENLRVLCATHNSFAAYQSFGKGYVESRIAWRRES